MQDSEERCHIDLIVVAEYLDGSDVPLPPVRLHLDSQWRRENGRGKRQMKSCSNNNGSSESPQVFVVSLLNQLKDKWQMWRQQ